VDKNEIITIINPYIELIRLNFTPVQIILFGSYAKGTASAESDIDIAVIVDKIDGDYLNRTSLLYKLRRDIDDRIEPLLLEADPDPSGFLKEIRRTGQVVFSAV
jgi:predicted nucleotidyltransferase